MGGMCVVFIYMSRPDARYGFGGVRGFMASITRFLFQSGICWKYEPLLPKPVNFGYLSTIVRLLMTFFLTLRLLFSSACRKNCLLYAHDTSYSGLAAILAGRIRRIPVLVHCHNLPSLLLAAGSSTWGTAESLYHVILTHLERAVLSNATSVIVTNHHLRRVLESRGIPKSRMKVISMGIDLELFKRKPSLVSRLRAEHQIPADAFVVGYVGAFFPVKNIESLLNAFASFVKHCHSDNSYLLLVGDGPQRDSLVQMSITLGIEMKTVFMGLRSDVAELLHMFDVFVMPSFSEGSPLAVLEAMANGVCLIASRIPSIMDIVSDEQEALLFDPHSSEEIRNALARVFKSPLKREKLAANALTRVREFDSKIVFEKVLRVFSEIVKP